MNKFLIVLAELIKTEVAYNENRRMVAETICAAMEKTDKKWTARKSKNYLKKCLD